MPRFAYIDKYLQLHVCLSMLLSVRPFVTLKFLSILAGVLQIVTDERCLVRLKSKKCAFGVTPRPSEVHGGTQGSPIILKAFDNPESFSNQINNC